MTGGPAKKGKGLSFDEKRKRMEDFFHEKVQCHISFTVCVERLFPVKRLGEDGPKGEGNRGHDC